MYSYSILWRSKNCRCDHWYIWLEHSTTIYYESALVPVSSQTIMLLYFVSWVLAFQKHLLLSVMPGRKFCTKFFNFLIFFSLLTLCHTSFLCSKRREVIKECNLYSTSLDRGKILIVCWLEQASCAFFLFSFLVVWYFVNVFILWVTELWFCLWCCMYLYFATEHATNCIINNFVHCKLLWFFKLPLPHRSMYYLEYGIKV
jgi:hypothetical protein